MRKIAILLVFIFISSLLAFPVSADIDIVSQTEPLSGIVPLHFNVTNITGTVSEVILTVDENTSNSMILNNINGNTWGIDYDTTNLENGNHEFRVVATSEGIAESATYNYEVQNDIRIIFQDVPETVSGFYLMEAKVFDERIDTTNNWYFIDNGQAELFPLASGNTFRSVIDVSSVPDGLHTFIVKAINIDNIVRMKNVTILVDNSEASLTILPSADTENTGLNGTYQLEVLAGGDPVTSSNVIYGIDDEVWDTIQYTSGFSYEAVVSTSNLSKGEHQLFVRVVDGSGNILAQQETVIQAPGSDFPWMLIFAMVIVVAISTFLIARKFAAKMVIPPEDVFLIYENGILIKHLSKGGIGSEIEGRNIGSLKVDEDLVTSMLIAIQDFVKTSFSQDTDEASSDLKHIGFGERTILMEKKGQIFLTMVVFAKPKDLDLDKYDNIMQDAANSIVSKYGSELDGWDGDMDSFEGLGTQLSAIFEI